MSIKLLNELKKYVAGSLAKKAVLKTLCECYNDETDLCNPSLKTIMEDSEVGSKVTLLACLRELEDQGVIERKRGNTSKTTRYSINLTKLSLRQPEKNGTDLNHEAQKYISENPVCSEDIGTEVNHLEQENSKKLENYMVQKYASYGYRNIPSLGPVLYPETIIKLKLNEKEINKENSDHALPFVSGKTQNSVETLHSKNLNSNITAESQASRLTEENLSLTKGEQGISVSTEESVPATESSPLSFGEGEKINPCDAPQNPSLIKKSVNDIADKQTNPVVTETTQPTVSCVGHGVSNEKQASCAQTASYQSTSRTNSKETDADCLSGDLFGFMEDSAPNRESVTSVRTIQGSYELPHPETKKMVKIEADFVRTEKPEEVSLEVWNDFIAFRRKKGKKSYITDGLIEKYSSIARQAGFSLEAVIQNCIDRDWQGINDAKWLLNSPPKPEGYTADFQYWKDFCFNCADKRKPMTKTRVEAFKQKVAQSGVSLNDAVQCCAEKGYADFVYPEYLKWLSERKGTNFGYKRFSAQSESQDGSPNNTNNVPTGSIFRWFASKSA